MRSYFIDHYGGIDGLCLRETDAPKPPGPGQVLVRMRAAALNFRELLILAGHYQQMCKPDLVPCSDGAGEVVAVGEGVLRVGTGDRVALTFHPHWIAGEQPQGLAILGRGGSVDGTLSEYACVSQDEVVVVPQHLSFEEASTLPCAALTAWSALCAHGVLLPGQRVLVQGTGGVSVFALQLAKLFGAEVVALSSSPEKLSRLRQLGADHLIDYRVHTDWHKQVLACTGGQGVDLTVEVGGGDTVERSVQATRVGGRVSMVGLLTGSPGFSEGFFYRGLSINTIRVGHREQFEQMNRAIALHRLRPVIDQVFDFDNAPEAFTHLQQRKHVGKVVIRIN
ncbi:NAD(P)-dependent alcohol dehydrogenase [Pseudomonas sp. CG7]|nr:NAD(P)-dependent alcohol dehydrogenase [Pseudomonas sp. CG7]MCM2459390.1 NAD(P)-dependent alcohol dehydrogenase [Pseudomonas sp. CG7]